MHDYLRTALSIKNVTGSSTIERNRRGEMGLFWSLSGRPASGVRVHAHVFEWSILVGENTILSNPPNKIKRPYIVDTYYGGVGATL